jgi:predicted nucleotidyltransferase
MKLDAAFDTFFDTIALRALSEERIGRAWGRLHEFLVGAYNLPIEAVFIQGSYANGTAIRPEDGDGEYDIDIVVVCIAPGVSAADAIADLRQKLANDGDLSKRLEADEDGRPCVRLRYAKDPEGFGFHIDVVPSRALLPFPPADFSYPKWQAPLEVPMRKREQWRDTAPLEYTTYCLDRGEHVRRTVRELKRWRDVHDAEIKSIVLQVLIAENHAGDGLSDADAIVQTLEAIQRKLSGLTTPPLISNPVLPAENLADRWDDKDFRQFQTLLDHCVALAQRARNSISERESHELWRELLGEEFPPYTDRTGLVPPPPPPGHRSAPQDAPSNRVEWG